MYDTSKSYDFFWSTISLYTIGNQLLETFLEHLNINKDEAYKLAVESLEKMRLKDIEEVLKNTLMNQVEECYKG